MKPINLLIKLWLEGVALLITEIALIFVLAPILVQARENVAFMLAIVCYVAAPILFIYVGFNIYKGIVKYNEEVSNYRD